MKKIEKIIKNNSIVNRTFTFFGSLVFKILSLFIKKEDKSILFVSYMGKNYNDSPKVLYEKIINDNYFDDYKIYWAFKDVDKFKIDSRVNVIKIDTFEYFRTALKVSHWITNVNIERGLHFKPNKTVYINTWHGIPLKKIGNDVKGRNDFNFSSVNYFPYSGTFEYDIYKRAFRLGEDNLFPTGMPRNDSVLDVKANVIDNLKDLYNIGDKKTILYAPTWREEEEDLKPLDIAEWKKQLGNEYVLLVRSHGLTKKFNQVNNDFVIDVSDYEETSDLITFADILVTDYSSIMFDFSLTEKPIFIYAPDYEKYGDERGTYFSLKEAPIFKSTIEMEVIEYIVNHDTENERLNSRIFKDLFFDLELPNSTNAIITFLKQVDNN